MESSAPSGNLYKIGAIATLTGLSTHTIRAWERRYGMELADRTDGGTRLYSDDALARLKLLRRLLDKGESISVLAGLSVSDLEARLKQFSAFEPPVPANWTGVHRVNGGHDGEREAECRLIYKSVPTEEIVSNETIADIVEKGAEKNRERDITGLLVLSGNEFLQVLEGPTKAVNKLYLTIAGDTRHKDVQLISFEQIMRRSFQTWSMRLVDLWDLPGSTRQYLLSKYQSEDEMIKIPESFLEIHSLLLDAKAFCVSQPWKL